MELQPVHWLNSDCEDKGHTPPSVLQEQCRACCVPACGTVKSGLGRSRGNILDIGAQVLHLTSGLWAVSFLQLYLVNLLVH